MPDLARIREKAAYRDGEAMMGADFKAVVWGGVTFAIGLALWSFTGDVETPVVTLTKVGVVLMVVGGLEAAYGLYRSVVGGK